MARRKLKNEAEAREALAAVSASGLSGVEWAAAHGVDARSLHGWRLSLQRKDRASAEGAPLRLVELVVPPAVAAPEARYRIRVGALVVEVDDHFEPETLRRLLAVVATC